MNSIQQFEADILSQLERDILSFGWLRQMSELGFKADGPLTHKEAVFDVTAKLVDSGVAVIGNAKTEGNMVVIEKWQETGRALRDKMRHCVDTATELDRDYSFWIQLTTHYNL